VIAAGGGAFAEPATREALQEGAFTVYIAADFETLATRVPQDGSRPLAADRAIMRRLLAEREPYYRSADLTVDATEAPEAVAGRIVAAVFSDRDAER
jgi:shikimate kinase